MEQANLSDQIPDDFYSTTNIPGSIGDLRSPNLCITEKSGRGTIVVTYIDGPFNRFYHIECWLTRFGRRQKEADNAVEATELSKLSAIISRYSEIIRVEGSKKGGTYDRDNHPEYNSDSSSYEWEKHIQ